VKYRAALLCTLFILIAAILPVAVPVQVHASSTMTRVPTGDFSWGGTWVKSTPAQTYYYNHVDETVPDDGDYISCTAIPPSGGYFMFTFDSFNLPAGSTDITLTVHLRAADISSGSTTQIKEAIRVNNKIKVGGVAHNPAGTEFESFSYTWTYNPETYASWTVDEINGISNSNKLQQFGLYIMSTNYSHAINISMVYVEVEYTPPAATLEAAFSASPTSGPMPLLVDFTDESTGSPTSWEWDFDNNGTVDSYDQNPSHTYSSAGTYTVKLTVSDGVDNDDEIKTDYIEVSSAIEADFSASGRIGAAPREVTFTDLSTGSPTSWEWDFDNNGTVDSYDQNPIHTYYVAGTYTVKLIASNTGGSDDEVKTNYVNVVANVSVDPPTGFMNTATSITVTGNGFALNTPGNVWFDTDKDSVMDAGEPQVAVTSTAQGALPPGTTIVSPGDLPPNSSYPVRVDIPAGSPVEAYTNYKTSTTTTGLNVIKYDPYGAIVGQVSRDYIWLRDNLPNYGNGVDRYYFQGPSFDDSSFDVLWNPGEDDNVESRDYGRPIGTDVKDLCELVGGAEPGDVIRIRASDNFSKYFDYEDIYNPEPEQGRLAVCWYNEDYGGYVPAYDTGMRLLFLADTSVNPWGWHVFGNWDMHETLPASRWHYYYSGDLYPSSSGLSVQMVYQIEIYQPNLVACDGSGNPQDSFNAGDTVYVKGMGLDATTGYDLWVQDEPVLKRELDGLDRPGGTYTLNTGNDPSGSQETITTNGNGDFGPTAIWSIDPSAGEYDYDIVADNQASGTVGTYDSSDAIDCPGWQGFSVTAPSEIISFTVTDYNNDGILFGSLDPGDSDQSADRGGAGAVTITVGEETNVDVGVQVSGTAFEGPETIAITNVKYDSDSDPAGAETLTESYMTWYVVTQPLSGDHITQVYYWITIPPGKTAGDYESTFSYKAVKQ
jgi:PKD repeat protein